MRNSAAGERLGGGRRGAAGTSRSSGRCEGRPIACIDNRTRAESLVVGRRSATLRCLCPALCTASSTRPWGRGSARGADQHVRVHDKAISSRRQAASPTSCPSAWRKDRGAAGIRDREVSWSAPGGFRGADETVGTSGPTKLHAVALLVGLAADMHEHHCRRAKYELRRLRLRRLVEGISSPAALLPTRPPQKSRSGPNEVHRLTPLKSPWST